MNCPPSTPKPVRKVIHIADQLLAERCARGRVVLIDDDTEILDALAALLQLEGYAFETYNSALHYLEVIALNQPHFPGPRCVICDVKMPVIDGLELQRRLMDLDDTPLLLMSGESGAEEAVTAFRRGVLDFLIKPIEAGLLLAAIEKALETSALRQLKHAEQKQLLARIASLTARERDIACRVARGELNREIAEELGISLRTVKMYRQQAMEKLAVEKVVDLARLAEKGGL
jgi:FixJ family two-component response regulator